MSTHDLKTQQQCHRGSARSRLALGLAIAVKWVAAIMQRSPSRWLFALGLLALQLPAWSAPAPRNIQFDNVTTLTGLSQQFVHTLVQDRQGFLWFGTQEGLNRFDGHTIRVFHSDPSQDGSLSNSFIWALYLDRHGRLWVGTEAGLNLYEPNSEQFSEPLAVLSSSRGIGSPRVRTITEDAKGVLWLGTVDDGLFAVDPVKQTVRHYRADAKQGALTHSSVTSLLIDRKDQLWVGTGGGGLLRFDPVTEQFVVIAESSPAAALRSAEIRSLREDPKAGIWIGTADSGLFYVNEDEGAYGHYRHDPTNPLSLPPGQVPSLFFDAQGTLWVGTENGLAEWKPEFRAFVTYRHNDSDSSSLVNDRINAMFQDASGVLWFATHGGVSRWNRFSEVFSYFGRAEGTLGADIVTSVAEAPDGGLWVGTYGGGLSRVDPSSDKTLIIHREDDSTKGLQDNRVMVVHVDQRGMVWVGTRSAGLTRFDPAKNEFLHWRQGSGSRALSSDAISSLYADADGVLWVGTFGGGLNRLATDGEVKVYRTDPTNEHSLSSDRVLAIHRDRQGVLWIGTEAGGISRLNENTDPPRFERYAIAVDGARAATGAESSRNTAWDILESNDGSLWIGTLGAGLLRWSPDDRKANKFDKAQRFGSAEGIPDSVYGVLEGAPGELWLSSSRGLTMVDVANVSVRHFDQRSGLRSNEFNQGARLRSRSGRLYFGSTDGLVAFDRGRLPFNSLPPRIGLASFSRDQRLLSTASGDEVAQIQLSHLDPFVSFEFVALDFVAPEKNRYRYRLDGFDSDWIDGGSHRRATYTQLPAGSYVFRVSATNNDGVWSERDALIRVNVEPPPWRSLPAYLIYSLAFLGIAIWLWRAQQKRIERAQMQRDQLEREVEVRTHELAERMAELQELNERLAKVSVTDSLTGLHNRRFVDEFVEAELSRIQRANFHPALRQGFGSLPGPNSTGEGRVTPNATPEPAMLFFMMIDLDGFKNINDSFGHHAGDQALIQVRDILISCVRKSDSVVRWGGDEFLIVGRVAITGGARILAERIREEIEGYRFRVGDGERARMSASIGIATFPFALHRPAFGHWENAIALADRGAYYAKSNGRNAWVALSVTPRTSRSDLLASADPLEQQIADGRLRIDSSIPLAAIDAPVGDESRMDAPQIDEPPGNENKSPET